MKRFKAYDPPEYQEWRCEEEVLEGFCACLEADPERAAVIAGLGWEALEGLYRALLRARLHDIALKRWVKMGVITKAWLATGEEAVTVGSVHALRREGASRDVVGPMIRNAAACLEMGIPARQMFALYLGTTETKAQGRDLHIGDLDYGVVAPVSHVGSLQPVMVGAALAFKMQRSDRVAMTWVGDGSTKTGEFHEGANMAASLHLPIVIFIQNNQVALGTRTETHQKGDFLAFADAYGMRGERVDGNNVLDVYAASALSVERARRGDGPTLVVAETFRMGGHATHDEAEGRRLFDADVFAAWGRRDPIGVFEAWLTTRYAGPVGLGVDDSPEGRRARLEAIEAEVEAEMDAASEAALAARSAHEPSPEALLDGVYV